MKKYLLSTLVLAISITASAQKEEISMAAILSDASTWINVIEREYGQEIVRMEFDILSSSKNTKTTYRTLSSGLEYGICAFGDYRIKDIDIKLYKYTNSQWILISKDEKSDDSALLTVEPPFDAEYKIEITAYKFADDYSAGHYGLIIYHE